MATTERKTQSADLAARASRVIPGGVNSGQRRVPGLEELVIAATKGSTFTDGEGNEEKTPDVRYEWKPSA